MKTTIGRALRRRSAVACATLALAAIGFASLAPACSLSDGQGNVTGTLNVPACWSGKFELRPDFFAGVPYRKTLQLRIQSGGDFESFSDGISILIDDVAQIRGADDSSRPSLYGVPLVVSLAPGVVPPGVPIPAVASPASVHFALYLQRTCHTQDVALYALDRVTVNADGTCDAVDGSTDPLACSAIQPAPVTDGGAEGGSDSGAPDATVPVPDAGAPVSAPNVRGSTITFTSLFDGNPDEDIAAKRLNEGSFDVYLADPRDVCPGGLGPPPRCRGHLTGSFKFYFQRGRPAQPFP